MINRVLLFAGCTLLFPSCDSEGGIFGTPTDREKKGNLYYRADFNTGGRLYNVEGDYIIATYQLSYDAPPEGAYDGDSGSDFHFRITDEASLEEGKTYNLQDSTFSIYATEWASPAGYDVYGQEKMEGSMTIVRYDQFEELVIDLDLKYGENDWSREYQKTITFRNSNPWAWAPTPALGWEDFDTTSSYPIDSITTTSIEGNWVAENCIMKDKNKASELLKCKTTYTFSADQLEYESSNAEGKRNLNLKSNRIGEGDEVAVINYISADSLVLTWLRPYSVMRHHYSRNQATAN